MIKELKPALLMLILMTVLTGALYPVLITSLAQLFFPHQASGSLLHANGQVVGSELIGQTFSEPRYFWGRISATSPMTYNAASSGGSNLGPLNPALKDAVEARIAALKESDPTQKLPIPVDLVTSSASGLDPHISPTAALWQVPRVARERKMSEQAVRDLVAQHTAGRSFGFLGEAGVNVLTLNLALDHQKSR
ncbi:MAG: potassium-transporting ATPase subunit KdpC [Magnetococcales bacterium]|nr:potassium-transporting ATPase subunit KdpC [Magnetococcales bacterium]